jgi:hypothetical protein
MIINAEDADAGLIAHFISSENHVLSPAFRRQDSNVIHSGACEACRLKAGLKTRFHRFNASQRDIRVPLCEPSRGFVDETFIHFSDRSTAIAAA